MKRKTITTTIGTINLSNIEFCENTLDVFIGIESVSADIQNKINEKEDERVWTGASVDVDLSEYQNELKKVIVKAMIDNFF